MNCLMIDPKYPEAIKKGKIETIQVNLGDRCNQSCLHCHMEASPHGTRSMDFVTAEAIAAHLVKAPVGLVEFTGGTPEMNPNLPMLIRRLSRAGKKITVRTSLTVLSAPEYADFVNLYRENGVSVIASLPCYTAETTDKQRGDGTYEKSIMALKCLNDAGYGTDGPDLCLVYNPAGGFLPPDQVTLEADYRENLFRMHGISFTRLLTITNAPIGRFKKTLEMENRLDAYCNLLRQRFNPATLPNLMCRSTISVDSNGAVYDCDFNLALGIPATGWENRRFWEIDFTDFITDIQFLDHCFSCTAGNGSSCDGALV